MPEHKGQGEALESQDSSQGHNSRDSENDTGGCERFNGSEMRDKSGEKIVGMKQVAQFGADTVAPELTEPLQAISNQHQTQSNPPRK